MKCPFVLPVAKYEPMTIIRDNKMGYVCEYASSEVADYIIQAINSYWNHKEYITYVHARIADGKPTMTYSKWLDTVEELEQALKEAEKPK